MPIHLPGVRSKPPRPRHPLRLRLAAAAHLALALPISAVAQSTPDPTAQTVVITGTALGSLDTPAAAVSRLPMSVRETKQAVLRSLDAPSLDHELDNAEALRIGERCIGRVIGKLRGKRPDREEPPLVRGPLDHGLEILVPVGLGSDRQSLVQPGRG